MTTPPNILVILTDQQTQQAIGAHGNPHLHTPHMDSLVHAGVSFENSYCTFPVCSPARSSLLTGRMPHETGVEVTDPPIRPGIPTMGAHFRRAGYRTYYAGKLHLGPKYRQGIEATSEGPGFEYLGDEHPKDVPPQLGTDTDPLWTDAAVAFLREQKPSERETDQPFLLVASLHNPHDICYWCMDRREFLEIAPGSKLPPLPANFEPLPDEPEFVGMCRQRAVYAPEIAFTPGWDETEWRRYLYAYYRLTERVDQQIGRLLTALEESGLSNDTLILLTSDHGEGVAAHKWVTKLMLWEEVVKVPFVVRFPGAVPEGRIDRERLVSGLDLLPTLCDYAGISAPEGVRGHSLRPLIEDPALPGRSSVVSELQAFRDDVTKKARMIRTAQFKYIIFSHGARPELLFDLKADPGETENLAYQPALRKVVADHRGLLLQEMEATGDLFEFPAG